LTSVVMLIGMFVVLVRMDAVVTVVALGIVPILLASIVLMSRRVSALATASRVKESAFWALAPRTMGAIRVVQAFATEELEHGQFFPPTPPSPHPNLPP